MARQPLLRSVITCIITLGTVSVVPITTNSILRSLAVDSIQSSTYTSTASSAPLDTTTTLTSAQFSATTTILANTETDTFTTATTLVSALLINGTFKPRHHQSIVPVFTNATVALVPVATGQAISSSQDPESEQDDFTNKKRSFGSRSLNARQLSAPAAVSSSSNNFPLSSSILPIPVCCFLDIKIPPLAFNDLCATARSVKTKVVLTAAAFTTTLVPIIDTTSTTETTDYFQRSFRACDYN